MTNKSQIDNALTTRRKIIKSTVGGAAVAVALPTQWSKPILSTVLTPAHAQTSTSPVIVTGVYASIAPIALNWNDPKEANSQYALLDLLIAPAKAQSYIPEVCVGTGDETDDAGNSTLYIRVNSDQTVDFAIDSLGSGDTGAREPCNLLGSVSVNEDGISIPSVVLSFREDENVQLTNMTLTGENEISGMYAVTGDGVVACSGSFTVIIGAVFPASIDCLSD